MFESLKNKTLLVMDRTALGACAVKRAKELGIKTIVANFYSPEDSPSKQVADLSIEVDISDTEKMVSLINEYNVDGVFIGWTDSHLPFYAEICKKAGLPCCGTKEQFEILSNDKHKFKELCLKYDVPTVQEYRIDINFKQSDLSKIVYPVMVKPADGSGGRGIKRCNNETELKEHYKFLYDNSKSKNIICEQFIESKDEIFLNYTIQDGFCSLSASYMSFHTLLENGSKGPAILHVYPSSHMKKYRETVESNVIRMFQAVGLKNGILSLQGFVTDTGFVFHETGLRMGGGQSYLFTKELNGVSALDLIIEYALTGKMEAYNLKVDDNPYFTKPCVNFYMSLKSGQIREIKGIEEVRNMDQVLQISTFHKVGDTIVSGMSVDSIIYRMHVLDNTKEELAKTLCKICNTIEVISTDGYEMQNECLTYESALAMLNQA